jgi:hypothetical protein
VTDAECLGVTLGDRHGEASPFSSGTDDLDPQPFEHGIDGGHLFLDGTGARVVWPIVGGHFGTYLAKLAIGGVKARNEARGIPSCASKFLHL